MDISVSKECIAQAKEKMNKALAHLEDELRNFKAGKANPAIFNSVMVDYYGSATPVPQVASINTPDAKTIIIQPWEKKLIPAIEKAIMDANLGFTPANNGEQIRINIPALTEDRRKELKKQVSKMGEDAKVAIRNIRRDANDKVKADKKNSVMTEDEAKQSDKLVQDLTDKFIKIIDNITSNKSKEIMQI